MANGQTPFKNKIYQLYTEFYKLSSDTYVAMTRKIFSSEF